MGQETRPQRRKTRWFGRAGAAAVAFFIVGCMSLGVAAPSYAADADWVKQRSGSSYKNYWTYAQEMWSSGGVTPSEREAIANRIMPDSPDKVTGGTQAKTGDGKALVGRTIQPGKSRVMIPEVWTAPKPVTGSPVNFASVSKFLGVAQMGMGGKQDMPAWSLDQYRSKVSEQCAQAAYGNPVAASACTTAEKSTVHAMLKCSMVIDAANYTSACASAYGVPAHMPTPPGNLWERLGLPLPQDLWNLLTGQENEGDMPDPNGHYQWAPRGCHINLAPISYDGGNKLTVSVTPEIMVPRPGDNEAVKQVYWDNACGAEGSAKGQGLTGLGTIRTICMDSFGRTSSTSGTGYGISGSAASYLGPWGKLAGQLCASSSYKLMEVFVIETLTESNMQNTPSRYSHLNFFHWVNPDPALETISDTKMTTSYTCTDGGGNDYGFSLAITGAAAWAAPECPPGLSLKDFSVDKSVNGGHASTNQNLGGGAVNQEQRSRFADCMEGGCALQVYVDGQSCTAGNADCEKWPSIRSKTPSRVTCKWGSYWVNSGNCNTLANAYQTETGVVYDPISKTWVAIDLDGNPQQPNPEPWNPANPTPIPGADPGTSTPTTPGTGTGTGGFPTTGVNAPGLNARFEDCMGDVWSWNPVQWVAVPVVCALEYAFVPTPQVLQAVPSALDPKIDRIGVGLVTDSAGVMFGEVSGAGTGGGCMGPAVAFPLTGQTFYPFNACDAPMSNVAAISRAVIGLSAVVFGTVAGVRAVGSAFGWNFSMGRGSGGD